MEEFRTVVKNSYRLAHKKGLPHREAVYCVWLASSNALIEVLKEVEPSVKQVKFYEYSKKSLHSFDKEEKYEFYIRKQLLPLKDKYSKRDWFWYKMYLQSEQLKKENYAQGDWGDDYIAPDHITEKFLDKWGYYEIVHMMEYILNRRNQPSCIYNIIDYIIQFSGHQDSFNFTEYNQVVVDKMCWFIDILAKYENLYSIFMNTFCKDLNECITTIELPNDNRTILRAPRSKRNR